MCSSLDVQAYMLLMAKAMWWWCKAQSQTRVLVISCTSFVFAKSSALVVCLDKMHGCHELSCIRCLWVCSCIKVMCSKQQAPLVSGPILHKTVTEKISRVVLVYIPTAVAALWKPPSKIHIPICLFTKYLLQASVAGIVIHSRLIPCYMYILLIFTLILTHCIANKLNCCKSKMGSLSYLVL